jgi:cyclic pyranopterin phosphate synthase
MKKNYIFDGHKLQYHSDRVSEFRKKGDCFPIYMEISPVGNCNHRCIFCAYDFIGHPNRKLETSSLKRFITQSARLGVKSILYAGEGEPLLHPDIADIINFTHTQGLDVGMFTNGELFTHALIKKIIPYLTFIRFSFNAGDPQSYHKVHQSRPDVFKKVVSNLKKIADYKRALKLDLDIGAQFVLLPENEKSLIPGIKAVKNTGADYFVIKPFVLQDNRQSYKKNFTMDQKKLNTLFDKAEQLSDTHFQVIARRDSFNAYGARHYAHCLGTSFVTVLNSKGELATCLPFWDNKKFIFGNIYTNSFKEIWKGAARKKIKKYLEQKLCVKKCPPNCRPNAINEFLWEITHPTVKHVNFI